MKTNIKTILFLSLMLTGLGLAQAQETEDGALPRYSSGVGVHSVNLALGYYNPEMDYWNGTYLPSKGIEETFGGNVAFGGNITLQMPANLRPRIGASYWSGKVSGSASSSIDELKIGITRINLGVLYAPPAVSFSGFQPYAGLEGQVTFINNTYKIDGTGTDKNGEDMAFGPVVGIERAFGAVNCGLEFKYNIGKYVQEESGETTVEHDVSINGIELTLSIGYRFNK